MNKQILIIDDDESTHRLVAASQNGPKSNCDSAFNGCELPQLKSTLSNHPKLAKVVAEYVSGLPATVANLQAMLQAEDIASLKRLAHQIRGAGGGYGFDEITQAAGKLEHAASISASVATLQEEASALVEILKRVEGYVERQVK